MDTCLTLEECRAWIQAHIFGFRPKDYCKRYPKWPGMVGLEIEMMAFANHGNHTNPLYGDGGSADILLNNLGEGDQIWQPEFSQATPSESMLMRIALEHNDQLTFEPGGQIEFSSKPYPCLSDAILRLQSIQDRLDQIFKPHQIVLIQSGINPFQKVEELGLQMPKSRYQAMNAHFNEISEFGARMMRQTTSIQVNVDFGDNELSLAKRFLMANLMAPLFTAIFANSPFCDGRDTGFASYRAQCWRHLDPSRTGFPRLDAIASRLDLDSCVDAYLDDVLDARVIFMPSQHDQRPAHPFTFRQWLAQTENTPTLEDFKTQLTLHFPEVRPKGFLELRSIDGLPRYWQVVPAAMTTSLLYDDHALDQGLELLISETPHLAKLAEAACFGFQDQHLTHLVASLTKIALDGLERLPACFRGEGTKQKMLTYLEHYTSRKRTPADDLREALTRNNHISSIIALESSWQETL